MAQVTQPQVPPRYKLLKDGYDHDGLLLDLYGTLDDDGYEVCAVTLTGTRVDLEAVTPIPLFDRFTNWCNDHLPSARLLRAAAHYEALADEARAERMFA